MIFRSGTSSSFRVSFLRSTSAKTKHRFMGSTMLPQAKRRLHAAPRKSCQIIYHVTRNMPQVAFPKLWCYSGDLTADISIPLAVQTSSLKGGHPCTEVGLDCRPCEACC